MGHALPARRVAVGLLLVASVSLGRARAVEVTAFDEADAAHVAYLAKVKALAAQRTPELEAASREAFDRAPCVRAELATWLYITADGAIADARADESSRHPGEVRDAVAAKVKAWKLPPPPGGKAMRLRLSLGTMPAAPLPARLSCEAELLDAGDYHVTQLVPGVEREKWSAVCRSGDAGAAEVRPVKVTLKRFRDSEDDADEKTGRRVTVKGCDAPAFLFQRVSGAADGPVPSAKVTIKQDGKNAGWNTTADITLGATSYRVSVQPQPANKDGDARSWRLLLDAGGAPEELDVGSSAQAPRLDVRWAGDLDGDGRPDFVLEDRDDGVTLHLYLSGAATGRRRVRQVATTAWGGS